MGLFDWLTGAPGEEDVRAELYRVGEMSAFEPGVLEKFNPDRSVLRSDDDLENRQLALADMLNLSATGGGPSLAETRLAGERERNLADALALRATARGPQNVGLMQKQTQDFLGSKNAEAERRAMEGKLSEAFAAREQLGQVLGQTRSQRQSQTAMRMHEDLQRRALYQALLQMGLNANMAKSGAMLGLESEAAKQSSELLGTWMESSAEFMGSMAGGMGGGG